MRTIPEEVEGEQGLAAMVAVFRHTPRALQLVWRTAPWLTILYGSLSLVSGVLPAVMAWVGKLIVDGVVRASASGAAMDRQAALGWVLTELGLAVVLHLARRGSRVVQPLLRARIGFQVNVMILEKALTLDLAHFEDPEFNDKLSRSRRQASSRPLDVVVRSFELLENALQLASYALLLLGFSPVVLAVLLVTGTPSFLVATRFSSEAFELFRWRTPDARRQNYLEVVLAREDFAKEVAIFGLGPLLMGRYRAIYERLYAKDRSLALRQGAWSFVGTLVGYLGFYGVYLWTVLETVAGRITLGEMTMYMAVFTQGQNAFQGLLGTVSAMYEDNLYLSTLYEFLEEPVRTQEGGCTAGVRPGDGIRFEGVGFTYPEAERPALEHVDLHLRPGERLALVGRNGSGKTTLVKLLARLYEPDQGRVLLDGTDLREWDVAALRARLGVIFQDFARYQLLFGENVGAGDAEHFEDEARWRRAAEKGLAAAFAEELPQGYHTQLGRWFKGGRELSLGQWQKVALSRAFMRESADILVLDEPTASMDAAAEIEIFQRFKEMTEGRMAVLISHRFSTVRMADQIAVLDGGRVLEQGTHEELLALGGRYATLFNLQAAAYVDALAPEEAAPDLPDELSAEGG